MADRAPFIRKVAEPDQEGVAHPVVRIGQMGYGYQGVEQRMTEDELPEGGYAADDPQVLRRFGITDSDWERVL